MKGFLQIYHEYVASHMEYIDAFPYCLAELWNPRTGIEKLRQLLHFSGSLQILYLIYPRNFLLA
jgi:hypothetical protein